MRTIRSAAKWTADAVGLVQLVYPRHILAVMVLIWFDNRHKGCFLWRFIFLQVIKGRLYILKGFGRYVGVNLSSLAALVSKKFLDIP
jgi:hypothetical protein